MTNPKLNVVDRVVRLAVGAGLVASVFADSSIPAYVTLLGIYPLITGAIGEGLISDLFADTTQRPKELHPAVRVTLSAAGAAMIAAVMFSTGTLGYFGILALLAVYPFTAAIVGHDPIALLFEEAAVERAQAEVYQFPSKAEREELRRAA